MRGVQLDRSCFADLPDFENDRATDQLEVNVGEVGLDRPDLRPWTQPEVGSRVEEHFRETIRLGRKPVALPHLCPSRGTPPLFVDTAVAFDLDPALRPVDKARLGRDEVLGQGLSAPTARHGSHPNGDRHCQKHSLPCSHVAASFTCSCSCSKRLFHGSEPPRVEEARRVTAEERVQVATLHGSRASRDTGQSPMQSNTKHSTPHRREGERRIWPLGKTRPSPASVGGRACAPSLRAFPGCSLLPGRRRGGPWRSSRRLRRGGG